jgi:KUP system potassium uptake protein
VNPHLPSTVVHSQLYLPIVNTALWISCVIIVSIFRHSSHLASAYGLAVTGAMLIDSILMLPVFVYLWSWGLGSAIVAVMPFLLLDVSFFIGGISKFFDGAWISALIALSLIVGLSVVYEAKIVAESELTL